MSLIKLANEVEEIIEEEISSREPLNHKRTGIAAGGIGALNAGLGNLAYSQWNKYNDQMKNFMGDLDPEYMDFLDGESKGGKNKFTRGRVVAKSGLAGAAMGAAGDQIIQRMIRKNKENRKRRDENVID